MQGLNLVDHRPAPKQGNPLTWLPPCLPDLSGLKQLEGLNLADNSLQAMPPVLSKLTKLKYLDLSGNKNLKVESSLRSGQGVLPEICIVDFI